MLLGGVEEFGVGGRRFSTLPRLIHSCLACLRTVGNRSRRSIVRCTSSLHAFFEFVVVRGNTISGSARRGRVSLSPVSTGFVGGVGLASTRGFLVCYGGIHGGGRTAHTEHIVSVEQFFVCLASGLKILRGGPVGGLSDPGLGGSLPGCLALRRTRRLVSIVSKPCGRQSCTVVALFLGYKVELSRLIDVGCGSVESSNDLAVLKGNGGRHAVCLGGTYVGTIGTCVGGEPGSKIGCGTLFLDTEGREVDKGAIRRVICRGLRGTNCNSEKLSIRGLHRATTALVCRCNSISLLLLGRILKRRGLNAARVCARATTRTTGGTVTTGPLGESLPGGSW